MPHCSLCHAATTAADTFCPLCGVRQEQTSNCGPAAAIRCAGCSAPLQAGDRFCAGCGTLRDVSAAASIPFVVPSAARSRKSTPLPNCADTVPFVTTANARNEPPIVVFPFSSPRVSRGAGIAISLLVLLVLLPTMFAKMVVSATGQRREEVPPQVGMAAQPIQGSTPIQPVQESRPTVLPPPVYSDPLVGTWGRSTGITRTFKGDGTGVLVIPATPRPGQYMFYWHTDGQSLTIELPDWSGRTGVTLTDRYQYHITPDAQHLQLRFLPDREHLGDDWAQVSEDETLGTGTGNWTLISRP